jgi:hypothetical protein
MITWANSRRTISTLVAITFLALTASFATAAPVSAADAGGDGNASACTNGYTVKSAPIYGSRGVTAGKVIGEVQLRWSYACAGNWSRAVIYGGMYTSPVTVQQSIEAEGRYATSNDRVFTGTSGTSAWTPYLRLKNSQSRACATVHLSSDFGTLNFHTNGASVCA